MDLSHVGTSGVGAPTEYGPGGSVTSMLKWPLPLEEVAKLNPELALAMGASRKSVNAAAKNAERQMTSRQRAEQAKMALKAAEEDAVFDEEELEIVRMLQEDIVSEEELLEQAKEKRRKEDEKHARWKANKIEAQKQGKKNVSTGERRTLEEMMEDNRKLLERYEKKKEMLRLDKEWEELKAAGEVKKILPTPGQKLGVTPRVYKLLKDHLISKSRSKRFKTSKVKDFSRTSLSDIAVADLRRVCDIVGIPSGAKKSVLVQMLLVHFQEAESHFAQDYLATIASLDDEVKKLKQEAKELEASEQWKRLQAELDGGVEDQDEEEMEDFYQEFDPDEDEEDYEDGDQIQFVPPDHVNPPYPEKVVTAFKPMEVVDILLKARGKDIVNLDISEKCTWTDNFIIATAKSPRHIRMLAGAVLYALKQRTDYVVANKLKPSIEGSGNSDEEGDDHWMLVDCGSCVVHCFSPEARERYDLEGLWAPGKELEYFNPEDEVMTIDTITVPDEEEHKEKVMAGSDGFNPADVDLPLDLEDMGNLEVRFRLSHHGNSSHVFTPLPFCSLCEHLRECIRGSCADDSNIHLVNPLTT